MDIVAMSSGTLGGTPEAARINDYIFGLVGASRPKVCLLPTATGDSAELIVSFYDTFPADRYQPSHLALFHRTVEDLRTFILSQDVIYVAGGNTANMLAIWRTQGLASILHEAWQRGIVLVGNSAGGLCWFEGGSTDSFGPSLAPIENCLGLLSGSFCPHYDSEPRRRPTYHRFVAEGLPPGWACDDGAFLHFEGSELRRIASGVPGARVYRVEMVDGQVQETVTEPEALW